MGGLLSSSGKKKSQPAGGAAGLSDAEKGQLEVKRTRDRLKRQTALWEQEEAALYQKAAEAARAGNATAAKRFLVLRKAKTGLIQSTMDHIDKLEEMARAIRTQQDTVDFYKAMESGTKALKVLQGDLTVEKAEAIMDEAAELTQQLREISEALGTPIAGLTADDDPALAAEMDAIKVALEGGASGSALVAAAKAAGGRSSGVAAVPAAATSASSEAAPAAVPPAVVPAAALPEVPTHALPAAAAAPAAETAAAEPEAVPA